MTTLLSLLDKGYFPRELPPTFKTSAFATFAVATGPAWSNASKGLWTRCSPHNLARPGGLRRPLKIPNPISYFALAEIVANNWTDIKAHTWRARLSASRPHIMKSASRAVVPRYRYGELPRLRTLRRRGARYLLITDIGQFYPSIYTHAIPWALHTKAAVRTTLRTTAGRSLTGNRLDKALQIMNDGQTHGIPIGPDASLVVAEILLSAIDQELLDRHPALIRGFRYVDDYELSFTNLSDSEEILSELQGLLAEYGLQLNARKTGITEVPQAWEESWSVELARFLIRDASMPVAQRNDLVSLFSRAFEIASGRPEDSVLRYAVARVQGLDVHPKGWRAFENCLLSAASGDPSTLAVVLGALFTVANRGGHTISKSPLSEIIESVIDIHARRGQGSEVSWALWAALAWSLPLSDKAAELVSTMEDNVVALLALHADAAGVFTPGSLDITEWTNLANDPGVLQSEHWLLAYEANQQGWIPSPAVAKNAVFSAMSRAGIGFYDLAEAKPQFPMAGRGLLGGLLPDYYA